MNRPYQFLLTVLLSGVTTIAASASFIVGPWEGKAYWNESGGGFSVCAADAPLDSTHSISLSVNSEHNMGVSIVRPGWGLKVATAYTVNIKIDDSDLGTRNASALTAAGLLIKLGPERAVRSALEHGAVLIIDTGTEVIKYVMADMQPLLAQLDRCVDTQDMTRPPPDAVPVRAAAWMVDASTKKTLEQRCDGQRDFLVYHGAWDVEPTKKDRASLHEYTEAVAACLPLWRARCEPLPLFPSGSTTEFCELEAVTAQAHLENRGRLERGEGTYRDYNNRAAEIDRVFTQASDSFFARVSKPIEQYQESQRQQQEALERQAAARREEELIGLLRQIAQHPSQPVITNCYGNGGVVNCVSQ